MNNKDLIAQYVDTGLKLSEYQVTQLPSWGLKSYMRKRFIAIENEGSPLESYEFRMLDDKSKWDYFIRNEKNNGVIKSEFLDETPDYLKLKVIKLYIDKEHVISGFTDRLFDIAPLELKQEWLRIQIDKNRKVEFSRYRYLDKELLDRFINKEIEMKLKYNRWLSLNGFIYDDLSNVYKTKIIDTYIKNDNTFIPDWLFEKTPVELQKRFVIGQAGTDYNIESNFYDELDNEVKLEYLEHLIVHLKKLRGNNWDTYLSDKRRDDYNRLKNEQ